MVERVSGVENSDISGKKIYCLDVPHLKGLGHVILGNFRTDQMVIEFTKISK